MALFENSTQASFWSLTPEAVSSARENTHREAVASRPSEPAPLTIDEESLIRRHHERRILRFNRNNKLPDKLAATAITYFKRFFLYRSVMDYNPAVIALSSIYASGKVEEIVFDVDDLVARFDASVNGVKSDMAVSTTPMSIDDCATRVSADALLNTELWFLQQINFHLICYHPFKSLGVVREKMSTANMCGEGKKGSDLLSDICGRAEYGILRSGLLSDLPLSYSPAVIAISMAVIATEAVGGPEEEEILKVVIGDNKVLVDRIHTAMGKLRSVPERTPDDEIEKVAVLEKRRLAVQKNVNDPMTDEFMQLEQDGLREEDEKEMKRAKLFQAKLKRRKAEVLGVCESEPSVKKPKMEV